MAVASEALYLMREYERRVAEAEAASAAERDVRVRVDVMRTACVTFQAYARGTRYFDESEVVGQVYARMRSDWDAAYRDWAYAVSVEKNARFFRAAAFHRWMEVVDAQ